MQLKRASVRILESFFGSKGVIKCRGAAVLQFVHLTQFLFLKSKMSACISEEQRCLIEILTCLLCKEMVRKAHICPNCSKFYCLQCIIKQLAVEESCLNCNRHLEVSMLVNCQTLCSELSDTLERVANRANAQQNNKSSHTKHSLYCSKHNLEKAYYCKTCDKPLCSDCSVLTENHRGHQFVKLSLVRNMYESKIHQKIDQINSAQKNIEKKLEMVEVIKLKKGTDNRANITKFQGNMKLMKQELKKGLKQILNEGEIIIDQITQKLELWNNYYEKLMLKLKSCSKGRLIEKQYDILYKQLSYILTSMAEFEIGLNLSNLQSNSDRFNVSYIFPIFESFQFQIADYLMLTEGQDYFYTNTVTNKMGLQWRLKIYPRGIGEQKNKQQNIHKRSKSKNEEYFAIFIEYLSGPTLTTRQRYELTLVNRRHQSKNFSRSFESQFDLGECWGYEHFIKLTQFYDEDFYNFEEDCLQIILKISPNSYFQASRDIEKLIEYKRESLSKTQAVLSSLQSVSMKELPSTSYLID